MVQPLSLLTILRQGPNYTFQVEPPDARGVAALHLINQTVSPQVRQQLQAAIEAAAHTLRLLSGLEHGVAPSQSPPAGDTFHRLGRLMHDLLLPSPVQSFLGSLTSDTPLLISTNDPLLPWELVHDGVEYLALKCPVGRRFLSVEHVRRNPPEPHAGKNFLLIADPTGDLPKTSQEIEALTDLLNGLSEWSNYEVLARQGATKAEVLSYLSAGQCDLIHYSGHVALDERGSHAVGLRLANGEVLTAEEIRLTVRGQPLVFLNGCSSVKGKADEGDTLDKPGHGEASVPHMSLPVRGLAAAFLHGGALGFIGTLWPVYDEAAYEFAVRFYRSALRGEPVGQALRQARQAIRQEYPADPIWASFVFYGHPTLRIAEATGQERRLVTSLYARLHGLATLFQRLSLEEAANVQEAGLKLLAQEIAACGGRVTSLSHEVILATFGAPQAYGDDAQRAASAALAMQRAWEGFNRDVARRTGARLQLSLALSTGEVIAGQTTVGDRVEYTARGESVELVARLGRRVPAGQVWTEEHTYRLTHHVFDFALPKQPTPELGRAIYRLIGPKPQPTSPLPGEGSFVGREEPLTMLRQCWQGALDGKGALITVVGVAGVGKSRLIETWRAELAEAACRWLVGTCQPQASTVPYGLLTSVLYQLFDLEAADDRATIRAKMRTRVERLIHSEGLSGTMQATQAMVLLGEAMGLESPSPPASDVDAGARRSQLARVIQGLLAQGSADMPWIILLEDVHWIDEASLAVVDRLAEGIAQLPTLLIVLYRPQWEHDWTARRHHRPIVLNRLTDDESQALLCALWQTASLPPHLGETVVNRAEGNPLFLKEMARFLVETRAVVKANGDWQVTENLASGQIPTTVQATIQARIDRLGENERWVLRMAAVIGLEFFHEMLAAMADMSPDLAVDEALDELRRQEFIEERAFWPEMRYAFQHALIQQVAYEGLVARHRQQLHRQAGQALEALYAGERREAHVEQLAYHFYEGEAWAPALTYQLRAGEKALALFAHEEARGFFERARALIGSGQLDPSREERRACYEGLGDVYAVQGRFDAARESYRAVLKFLGTERSVAADLCRKMAQTYERQGQYDQALEWLRQGLDALGERQDDAVAARIYLLQGIIDVRQGRLDQAFTWAERALRAAEGKRALAEEAQASNLMGVLYRARGELERAAECCQRSAELYEAINNPLKAAAAYSNLGVVALERDDWSQAEAAECQALKLQASTGDAYGQATLHCNLADLYWRPGRLAEALDHAQAGLRLAQEIGSAYLQALAHENLGIVYLRQGASGPVAREHLTASWRLLEENDIQELRSEVQSWLTEAHLRAGRLDKAKGAAQRALEIALEQASPLSEGVARRALGRVYRAQGDSKQAERELRISQEVLEAEGRRYEVGRTLRELAALYAEDEARRAEARAALERALAIFEQLGAGLDLEEAQTLIEELE
jgi:class 3 adenylate cyclase/tetratricopeptide (TPR) repeat protein